MTSSAGNNRWLISRNLWGAGRRIRHALSRKHDLASLGKARVRGWGTACQRGGPLP
jgi:hypothetical protein